MLNKILFIILIFLITLSPCFSEEFLIKDSKIKICILHFKSDYKNELVKKIVKVLNENKMNVTVDSIINSNNYKTELYDAVIILADIQAGNRRVEVTKYINSSKKSDNIILIDTNKSSTKYPKIKNADSFTAASIIGNINETAYIILSKTKKIIKK